MRIVSSLAAWTLLVCCPAFAIAADAPTKGSPSKSESPHSKDAKKAPSKKHAGKGEKKKDGKGIVLASATTKGSKDDKKPGLTTVSAKTPEHASKVDRHADAKSRAKGGNRAEIKLQHQVKDTLGRHHADTHAEPTKQELERMTAEQHRAEEQKLLAKVRFGRENGVDLKPASAKQEPASKGDKADKADKKGSKHKPTCNKPPVDFLRGDKSESVRLMTCEGSVLPEAVKTLSELVKPVSGNYEAKHVEPRLIGRLEQIAEHFAKGHMPEGDQGKLKKGQKSDFHPAQIEIVSGYRPYSKGSYHSHARAVDIRVKGVKNEELLAFCKTLEDTGCGYYPNSTFVHIDARDPGAGHVSWIDASGPGETPRYVSAWPPPADADDVKVDAKTDKVKSEEPGDKKGETPREEPLPVSEPADKAM